LWVICATRREVRCEVSWITTMKRDAGGLWAGAMHERDNEATLGHART
jgi:hypothetical protein